MDAKAALTWLQSAPVQPVALADLRTDEAFQPRAGRLIPTHDKARAQRRSDEQKAGLRLKLQASQGAELDAILVADIDGELFIVDGHHRVAAYALEKRSTIPAQVRALSRRTAVLVSKLVNCPDRSLEMHQAQYREAAWQWMADVRRHVARLKDIGESYRTVGATFRIDKDTVARMWNLLPTVDPNDFNAEACDPGTGFPCWKYVCQPSTPWKDMQEMLTPDQLMQHRAAKAVASACGKLGDLDAETLRAALALMPDALRELASRDDDADDIARLAYDDEGRSGDALMLAMQPDDEDCEF